MKTHYQQDRRIPSNKQRPSKSSTPDRRVAHHILYGDIPLIHESAKGRDGKIYEWWSYDPNFRPSLPRGAVRGDVRKQLFCAACHVPKYFFVDEERTCLQCGTTFTFRADEQKYWYETLKFHFDSVPVRCLSCRRQRRSEHALREQIARAKSATRSTGTSPAAHLALARAVVEYHERTSQGNLNEAIAAARKAAHLWPDSAEPFLWEGIAQALAGRRRRARQCLGDFLSQANSLAPTMREKAQNYLKRVEENEAV